MGFKGNMVKKDNIISVRNLNFFYDHNQVLHDLNFDIFRGDFISILGPNGAGKSTLVNLISRVLEDYRGRIEIDGKDIRKLHSRDIAKIVAVVPQNTNPGFDFTVFEMIMMGRHSYISRFGMENEGDYNAVNSAMEKTETLSFANRKYSELSGGEKQRVIIAQALAQDSDILLLDEPTSHLDINFQIEFINLFLSLNREEGKTVVGIFHDINLALQNSQKMMLIKDGRIFDIGIPENIISRESIKRVFGSDVFVGKNPVTQKLFVSPIFIPAVCRNTPNVKSNKNIKIHVIGGGGAASPVINLLNSRGYEVSCGVINTLDTDVDTAQMLEIPYVTEAPFSPISMVSQSKNLNFIKSSDVVILPGVEFGYGNFPNLLSVKEALMLNKKVIVVDEKSIRERDHTDGKAGKLYRKILESGAVAVESIDKILLHL